MLKNIPCTNQQIHLVGQTDKDICTYIWGHINSVDTNICSEKLLYVIGLSFRETNPILFRFFQCLH